MAEWSAPLPAPAKVKDPGHVQAHNELTDAIREVRGVVDVTSSDEQLASKLADPGEVKDVLDATVVNAVQRGTGTFDIRTFGAKVDGVELTDVAMTAGSAVLTTSYTFTATDVGKHVGVSGAGYQSNDFGVNANDGVLLSTIASVDAGVATLAHVAVSSCVNAEAVFGTRDSAAIEAAQNAAVAAGGGTVYFPPGRTVVYSPLALQDRVHWVGAGRDISWVDVLRDNGTNEFTSGNSWMHCSGRTADSPLTDASFHDFGVNARFHIRSGGFRAFIKALNIFQVRRCSIYNMNVWNTGGTSIPFDHAYESVNILCNVVKNPGRLFSGTGGGSGIGIGATSLGVFDPCVVAHNSIIGVGNESTAPRGNNGIFVEGQSASGASENTPNQGYRIHDNYIRGMATGIGLQGERGTLVHHNIIDRCMIGIRITPSHLAGSFPGVDGVVEGNTITNCTSPAGTVVPDSQKGTGIFVSIETADNVKIRPRILNNQIMGAQGKGIWVYVNGPNDIDQAEIRGNKIRETQRSGIYLSRSAGMTGVLTNLFLDGNVMDQVGLANSSGDRHGIYLNLPVVNPFMRDNTVIGSVGVGIILSGAAALTGVGQIRGNVSPTVTVTGSLAATVQVLDNIGWPS